MKFRPIRIDIKDDKKFTDVALLIDNPSFILDVLKFRKQVFGLSQSPAWLIKTESRRTPQQGKEYSMTTIKNSIRTGAESRRLRKKHHRPPSFDTVIHSAILENVVAEGDYKLAYASVIDPKNFNPKYENPSVVIVIHPGARVKDVISAFRSGAPKFWEGNDYRTYGNFIEKTYDPDTISTIKFARKLYWAHNYSGLGYKKLATKFKTNVETIKSTIKNYESKINKAV